MSEGDDIGWEWSEEDVARHRGEIVTETDKMLAYHDLDPEDMENMSNNEIGRLWWNYRKFGKSQE